MAEALRAPVGQFCEEVAREEGIPPVNQRVIHKPLAQRNALYKQGRLNVVCNRCGGRGHGSRSKKCPMSGSPKSSLEVLKARSKAGPTKPRKPRKRREP
jgi:ribosomal protein L37E